MRTRSKNIHVLMPDDKVIEATFYCDDKKVPSTDMEHYTKLYIQLDDCVCTMTIPKSVCANKKSLEHLVQSKVINSRGHLC